MKKVILLSITAIFIITSPTWAQNEGEFTIGGQYKPRFEYRNGFKRPILETQNPAYFVEQRARLWADYKTSKFRIHINLQDVRMWGATNQIYKADGLQDGSLTNVYEAFGTYFINANMALRVGRQQLDYDNARFLGNLDWAMQGRSHDGVVFIYQNDNDYQFHIGGALNQVQFEPGYLTAAAYNRNNYKNMQFFWMNKAYDNFNYSVLFHNDGREAVGLNNSYTGVEYHRQTLAVIPTYNADAFTVGGEFYYQFGKNVASQDVSAFFINAYFTLKTDVTPITIGVDYASGTAWNEEAAQDNSWNPLYGTNHKFYGYMDYFYVGNGHGQFGRTSGLVDLHLKTNFKFSQKSSLSANAHYFLSPVEIVDLTDVANGTTLSNGLGLEIDLTYKVVLTKGVAAFVAYSHMFETETMYHIKPINNAPLSDVGGLQNWVWLGMNFSGDLFKSKN